MVLMGRNALAHLLILFISSLFSHDFFKKGIKKAPNPKGSEAYMRRRRLRPSIPRGTSTSRRESPYICTLQRTTKWSINCCVIRICLITVLQSITGEIRENKGLCVRFSVILCCSLQFLVIFLFCNN